jgi:hypothetical protein
MKRALAGLLFLCLGQAGLLPAQAAAPTKQPLRILFLGDPASPRTTDFAAFLGERFTSVRTGDRWSWDRALLAEVDLVVLDWPQQDGISKWMLGKDRTVPPKSPLGARAEWTRPTVLVGSAGLNTAWAWNVKGGWG